MIAETLTIKRDVGIMDVINGMLHNFYPQIDTKIIIHYKSAKQSLKIILTLLVVLIIMVIQLEQVRYTWDLGYYFYWWLGYLHGN